MFNDKMISICEDDVKIVMVVWWWYDSVTDTRLDDIIDRIAGP